MSFSKCLQDLRKSKCLSQLELATILNVSDRSISLWERGLAMPNTETTIKIADYFDVSADYLLGRDTNKIQKTTEDTNLISIQRAYSRLSQVDKEKMMAINKAAFQEAFSKGADDDTI